MSSQLLLVLKSNKNKFSYKSDVIADVFLKDENLGNKLLASFGLSYGLDIKTQTLKTANCLNHLRSNFTVNVQADEGTDVPSLLDKKLLKSYIKQGQKFIFTEESLKTSSIKLQAP